MYGVEQIGEHETKFVLPNCRATSAWSWLSKRCIPDPDYSEGIVSSIYFDSSRFDFLLEKLNSTYLKTKVRLRWYSSVFDRKNYPSVFLEVKNKVGSARLKKRIPMDFDSSEVLSYSLGHPFFYQINRLLNENEFVLNKTVYPAFQINYRRSRFIDPMSGARLSIDRDIHASRVNRKMVKKTHPVVLNDAVFEFKDTTGNLPDWFSQLIAIGECRKGAFSKYSVCYAQLLQTYF